MKTGYCHIYNHKLPLDSITDRLHIGNRWLGHLGLAMYDNTARVHDPVMPHMLTCDSRAVDYPGHSPFSHCAGNPANISDKDGNKIKLNGNADDINQTLNLLQNTIGNYYSLSCGNDGMVNMSKPLKSFDNLTNVQQRLVNKLDPMLSDELEMNINITNNDPHVKIGDVRSSSIDIADIMSVMKSDIISPMSLLWHELVEQWEVQNVFSKEQNLTEQQKENVYNHAHWSASKFESLFSGGKYSYPIEKMLYGNMLKIPYVEGANPKDTMNVIILLPDKQLDTNK